MFIDHPLLNQKNKLQAAILKNTIIGFGGAILLAVFFIIIISFEKMLAILPLIIVFNGTLVGYRLIESTRYGLQHKVLICMIAGLVGEIFCLVCVKSSNISLDGFCAFFNRPLNLWGCIWRNKYSGRRVGY